MATKERIQKLIALLMGGVLISPPCAVNGIDLTANQDTIFHSGGNPTTTLTLTCTQIPGRGYTGTSMEIGKREFGRDYPITRIHAGTREPDMTDPSLQGRISARGYVSDSSGMLEIKLPNLQCSDATTYYCAFFTRPVSVLDKATVNVSTISNTMDVQMFIAPNRFQYKSRTRVAFTCTGMIGKELIEDKSDYWVWEWRRLDTLDTPWKEYPHTDNIHNDNTMTTDDCQYKVVSTLNHTLTMADNGRQFRCYVVKAEYGAIETIFVNAGATTHESTAVNITYSTEDVTTLSQEDTQDILQFLSLCVGFAIGVAMMLVVWALCRITNLFYKRITFSSSRQYGRMGTPVITEVTRV